MPKITIKKVEKTNPPVIRQSSLSKTQLADIVFGPVKPLPKGQFYPYQSNIGKGKLHRGHK